MVRSLLLLLLSVGLFAACTQGSGTAVAPAPAPEVALGERLFLETRFAQYFSANFQGQWNQPLAVPDPILAITQTTTFPLPGAFASGSMNCAACHLVDQNLETPRGGMRSYNDFARRTPIPLRKDGKIVTVRNSPPLVNSALERPVPLFLHFDAEFESLEGLVRGTLTGRNFGWLQDENETAVAHIAGVIKNDDGRGELAKEFGGIPYKILLKGEAAEIPEEFRIPENFRIDVENADGKEILNAVAKLIGAYVQDLVFIRDDTGAFAGSPYDKFLEMNGLPRKPQAGETDLEYARRLLELINKLEDIQYVAQGRDGEFAFHEQDFRFGPDELKGLKIFFAEAPASGLAPSHQPETDPPQAGAEAGGIGNCIACHAPPAFTDFKFHNTGVTQAEYDLTHSGGAFQALFIPDYFERNAKPELYLPPSPLHPYAAGKFFDIPSLDRPGATDLGLWNVLGNPNVSHQEKLLRLLCEQHSMAEADCVPEKLLPLTVAQFKTPGLRDMGHSAPYMHNGEMDELKDVVEHYRTFSDLARKGEMRNAPEEFSGLALGEADVSLLVNFLESLNEDYE